MAASGEMGYPSVLSAPTWGFEAVSMHGKALTLGRPLGSYVMENVLFKISYPAEFHGQTAVEAAITLHQQLRAMGRRVETSRISRSDPGSLHPHHRQAGPLHNPADRDHCVQYMVAIALLHGRLVAEDYEDDVAADPRIDALRAKMACHEDPQLSADYLDPDKRSIANGLGVRFSDGTELPEVLVEYPLGHAGAPGGRHSAADGQVPPAPGPPLPDRPAAAHPGGLA